MGGHWGAELKFAGWDSIIIQGKAEHPVWLYINDDKVELRDARRLWGNGIFRTTAEIAGEVGSDTFVAAIGQAGENLVRLSCVICERSHSAGGVGSVMGSKNLKAIAVKGTGALQIAADPKSLERAGAGAPEPAGGQLRWCGAYYASAVGGVLRLDPLDGRAGGDVGSGQPAAGHGNMFG